MAAPKVFVSSTFYDLKYIRENLRYFIKRLGYEPILSEDGSVFYDPKLHTHESCLTEIPNCQMLVLIIGGRYGGTYKGEGKSITNMEYEEAKRLNIPIFALVERNVYSEHFVYSKNAKNTEIEISKLIFPSVDNIKIFDFIDDVRKNSVNNAIVPFSDFAEIEDYLLKQWAGLLFSFLAKQIEDKNIANTLDELKKVNSKIEYISEQILKSVGSEKAKLTVELYEESFKHQSVNDFAFFKLNPSPPLIFKVDSFEECAKALKPEFEILTDPKPGFGMSSDGKISQVSYKGVNENFLRLKKALTDYLASKGWTVDRYLDAT